MMGNVLGIDPGIRGGLALLSYDGILQLFPMPPTEADLADLFEARIKPANVTYCIIEQVHAIPAPRDEEGKIKEGMSTIAAFTFGRIVGVLIGLLLAHKIPFDEMPPKTWQRALGIPQRIRKPKKPKPFLQYPAEESVSEWKNRLRAKAQALFPGLDLTLKTADAALIAEVAKRIQVGYQGRQTA